MLVFFFSALLGTADQYELGNFGEKYGMLDDFKTFSTAFNETQMSLFGPFSILGRSVVVHQKVRYALVNCLLLDKR